MTKTTHEITRDKIEGMSVLAEGYRAIKYDSSTNGDRDFRYGKKGENLCGRIWQCEGDLEIGHWGLHFSKDPANVFDSYEPLGYNRYFKVRAYENAVDRQDTKTVTVASILEFVEEYDLMQFIQLIKGYTIRSSNAVSDSNAVIGSNTVKDSNAVIDSSTIKNSNAISYSNAVIGSNAVKNSSAIKNSNAVIGSSAIKNSNAVIGSSAIKNSNAVIDSSAAIGSNAISDSSAVIGSNAIGSSSAVRDSNAIKNSSAIRRSSAVIGSNAVSLSNAVRDSRAVSDSYAVIGSNAVKNSSAVSYSNAVIGSNAVRDSYAVMNCWGLLDCEAVKNGLLSVGLVGRKYVLFNKGCTKERFTKVYQGLCDFNWRPQWDNFYELKGNREWWSLCFPELTTVDNVTAWSKIPLEMLVYIKSLPEFNAEVWAKLTGNGQTEGKENDENDL